VAAALIIINYAHTCVTRTPGHRNAYDERAGKLPKDKCSLDAICIYDWKNLKVK